MLQLPDINPFLKGGLIGVMAFVIVAMAAVIAWLFKHQVISSGPKIITREPSAGEKSPEYWEERFAEIETEGNKALLQVLREDHRAVMEMLGKLRAKLRDSDQAVALKEIRAFRAKYDQDMVAIAKMLRSIEVQLDR